MRIYGIFDGYGDAVQLAGSLGLLSFRNFQLLLVRLRTLNWGCYQFNSLGLIFLSVCIFSDTRCNYCGKIFAFLLLRDLNRTEYLIVHFFFNFVYLLTKCHLDFVLSTG